MQLEAHKKVGQTNTDLCCFRDKLIFFFVKIAVMREPGGPNI